MNNQENFCIPKAFVVLTNISPTFILVSIVISVLAT